MAAALAPFAPKAKLEGYQHREFYIPLRMMPHLARYIQQHEPVGDFLTAVLCNDMKDACGRADDENLRNLPAYIAYLYNEAPSACWGSPAKVKEWLKADSKRIPMGGCTQPGDDTAAPDVSLIHAEFAEYL